MAKTILSEGVCSRVLPILPWVDLGVGYWRWWDHWVDVFDHLLMNSLLSVIWAGDRWCGI